MSKTYRAVVSTVNHPDVETFARMLDSLIADELRRRSEGLASALGAGGTWESPPTDSRIHGVLIDG